MQTTNGSLITEEKGMIVEEKLFTYDEEEKQQNEILFIILQELFCSIIK